MKRILFSVLILTMFKGVGFAAWGDEGLINQSSFTMSSEGPIVISTTLCPAGSVFDGVVVASSIANGSVTFWDDSNISVSTIGIISMSGSGNGAFYIPFEVRLSSGLMYKTTGNTAGITIIYKNIRPR